MTVLTAYCRVVPEHTAAFLAASRANKAHALGEEGCERFDFFRSPDDLEAFVFVEEWATREHLEAHFQAPPFAEFMAAVQPCLECPPDIRIFEAELAD